MKFFLTTLVASVAILRAAIAQEVIYKDTLSEQSVETRDLFIWLSPVDSDVRFSVTLENKGNGFKRRLEFEGQGANDPAPFQMTHMIYCDTPVILLTVKYPWHHALPEFVRVLDTFAFRTSDFAFIDMTPGPLTDIALADDTAYGPSELDMLPPIRVRCLLDHDEKPFQFFEQETK